MPRLPKSRGPLSAALFAQLPTGQGFGALSSPDGDEDAQIALWALYELHYRGFIEVDEELEWDPDLLRLRRGLEISFESRLRASWEEWKRPLDIVDMTAVLEDPRDLSVARFVQRNADREQALEILRHRSIYHLKEADPTSWVIPRLETRPKAALLEIQFDEYGDGDPNRLHHRLFEVGLEALGLCSEPGGYIDEAPCEVLEVNNAMSLFGLHRRLRGAVLGHFAAFEATSCLPSRQMAQGLRRLGLAEEMCAYYDEHVEADAVHEQLALGGLCGSFLEGEPEQTDAVLFGAFTCLDLEERYARSVLSLWDAA